MFKLGLGANTKVPPGNNPDVENLNQMMSKVKGGLQIGRVTDIILNGQYPNIDKYGGLNSIGNIFYELNNFIGGEDGIAKPLFPQMSSFPLVNEMVLLFKLPNSNIGRNTSEESYYYLNMINLWNHPHHNAYPNPTTTNPLQESQQRDYKQTEGGAVRRVTDEETGINLNSAKNLSQATFSEIPNIHPLLPFAGDTIYQGRWGNSIRLGSTAKSVNTLSGRLDKNPYLNDWSIVGENGNPITIFRNGQPSSSSAEGWKPITEKVNEDLSSIYLTSNQSIDLILANSNFLSHQSAPTPIKSYNKSQVILNADRVVLNSKEDSVILSGQKTINLSSNSSVNINTSNLLIDAGNIRLGDKNAKEAVVKGNTLHFQLDNILKVLIQLTDVLSTSLLFPDGVPIIDIEKNTIYSNIGTSLQLIKDDLETMLSKNVKTI